MNVLILNSAQGKHPRGIDPWVIVMKRIFGHPILSHSGVISSTDPVNWNLATWLAGRYRKRILLIVMAYDNEKGHDLFHKTLQDYDLDHKLTTPLFIEKTATKRPKSLWPLRDKLAIEHADRIIPVSIRRGGRLDSFMNSHNHAPVIGSFSVPWKASGHSNTFALRKDHVNDIPHEKWVVHWTRSAQGAWPDERPCDYFHDMFAKPSQYVRDAFSTLIRILSSKRIIGTTWRKPGSVPAVSFTGCSLREALSMMQWRKRYVRYSYEPFGIAIKRDMLADIGGGPVMYDPFRRKKTNNKLFVQAVGSRTDWTREREWRIRGDLDLSRIADDDIMIIVPTELHKKRILQLSGQWHHIHVLGNPHMTGRQ